MNENPARALRALVKRNKAPDRALFAPQVFAAAAGIEALGVYDFLGDPTKLAKGLGAARQLLGADAMYSYVDAGGIAAGLGASLDISAYPPVHAPPAAPPTAFTDALLEQVLGQEWVAAGLEVTRRLASDPLSKLILAVSLPGPATLAASLDIGTEAGFEFAGQLLVGLSRSFGEAGARLFVIDESSQAPAGTTAWETHLTPIVNVTRFFQALPVLLAAPDAPRIAGAMAALAGASNAGGACVLSADPARWQAAPADCALILTAAEVASDVDFGELRAAAARVRPETPS